MKIKSVEVFVYKYNHHYRIGGHGNSPNRITCTDYYVEPQWQHAYSRLMESCIIKITTDEGVIGWGESQAPVVPEVPATLIAKLLGPAIIGLDPTNPELIYNKLYHLNHVRGHTSSFNIDAIAGIDIALWDIKSKTERMSLNQLLGNKIADKLPLYISGLRKPDLSEKIVLAKEKINEGFKGIKLFIGDNAKNTLMEFEAIRVAIGKEAMLALDAIGRHHYSTACQIGIGLDELNASWFETPLDPENIEEHAKLAKGITTPLAIGEALRTVREFEPWINKNAMRIVQPDIVRCGITGGLKIIQFAKKKKLRIAPHLGVCTAIGIAATWHVSSTLSHVIQEHQLEMFNAANKVLQISLKAGNGYGVLPESTGIGIKVDEDFIEKHSSEKWIVSDSGITYR